VNTPDARADRYRPIRTQYDTILCRTSGLVALQLCVSSPAAFAESNEVFTDRASQKQAILQAARAKAAAQAAQQAPPSAAVNPSSAQFRSAETFKEQDVRMQGARVTEEGEGYVAATQSNSSGAPEKSIEAVSAQSAEEAAPENVNVGGGFGFGLFQ